MYDTREMEDKVHLQFKHVAIEELGTSGGFLKNLENVNVQVRLLKVPDGISGDFEVDYTTTLPCVRCLEQVEVKLREKYHLDYVLGRDPYQKTESVNLDPRDIDRVYYRGFEIDLSIGIREMIILALPFAPVCKPDCAGLCPVCGRNLNEGRCACQPVKGNLFKPKSEAEPRRKIRAAKKK